MGSAIDYTLLSGALRKFKDSHKYGAWSALERRTGVFNIGRIARGQITPTPSTWERLHRGAPDIIPAPPWMNDVKNDEIKKTHGLSRYEHGEDVPAGLEDAIRYLNLQRLPVFNCGAGPDCHWTDGGLPTGESDHFIWEPGAQVDENSFGVIIHGDSMSPTAKEGDVAVVVPSLPPQHGKLCFASWSRYEDGKRLIRRYFKYGDTVVLRPDNPDAGEEMHLDDTNGDGVAIYRVKTIRRDDP